MNNFIKFCLRCFFRLTKVHFKIDARVRELCTKGVYVSNHVSWLDPLILYAFLPNNPIMVLHDELYRNKYIRFFLKKADVMSFDCMDPMSIKDVIAKINEGRMCCVFPEGRMTDMGNLMKIYEAPCLLSHKTNTPIIPVWIEGLQFSPFSQTKGYLPHRLFPKTFVYVDDPIQLKIDDRYKQDRDYLRNQTYTVLKQTYFKKVFNPDVSVFGYLIKVAKIYGKDGLFHHRLIAEDIQRKPVSYKGLLIRSYILGKYFSTITKDEENVGVLLPNMIVNLACFFGLNAYGRTPVMLNFSAGPALVASMAKTAVVQKVITSQAFILKAGLQDTVKALQDAGIEVVMVEDVAKKLTLAAKIKGLLAYKVRLQPCKRGGYTKAAILFTSGSEGMPKGVVLTHAGIVGNVLQTSMLEKLHLQDLLFNSLPMFHSFGLTVGCFFSMFQGAKVFLFPSPLQHRVISELLYKLNATVMVATDTLYRTYAKIAHPYDFRHVRLCYAGAEAVKNETRRLVLENLGIRLMEAYGTTECSPVLCGNNSIFNKFGTLGKLVVGVEHKILPVDGIAEGGELCVKGPNVMQGYIFADNPGVIVKPEDGWYRTGDVVEIDEIGFVKMKDRIKRFAKVGGEMVSLSAVEIIAKDLMKDNDDFICGAVAVPHDKKGEQIILVSNNREITNDAFVKAVQEKEISQLYIPSVFLYKEDIPVLGTGKTDFISLKKWVLEQHLG